MAWRFLSRFALGDPKRPHSRTRLEVESLESLATPAALGTYEIGALQVVNQLRADPAAFANDLKQLYQGGSYQSPYGYAASDPIWTDLRARINAAEATTSWRSGFTSTGPNTFLSVASALAAKAPLVWDSALQDGAVGHDQWMYANVYAHSVFTQGAAPSTSETPANHIPGIARNFNVSQGDFFDFIGLGLNAAGEDISYAYNQSGAAYQAYKNGQIALDGYDQRLVYADTIAFMMEYANGSPSSPWGHLQNLASATYDFNVIGMSTFLYENPAESALDGVSQSYFSTHRLGLRANASYANLLVYQDLNNNNVYDAGEGVPGQVSFNFGAGSVALPATGYSGVQLPTSGTYAVSATYLGNSLGSQQFVANGANKTFAFKVGTTQTAAAPQLVSVTPNGNIASLAGTQHSRIASLVVVFDQAVQFDANALTLALHTNNVVWNGVLQPAGYGTLPTSLMLTSNDKITWVVTFAGNTDNGADGFNSLMDGVYDFNVAAAKVHPFGVPGVNMAQNATTVFHRLFGDSNAPDTPSGGTPNTDFQAVVNTSDNLSFRGAFNNPATYKAFLDFGGDGLINTSDNLQFRNRFNKPLTWKI